eukprot:16469-Heterococcus_DN1.PRE.2
MDNLLVRLGEANAEARAQQAQQQEAQAQLQEYRALLAERDAQIARDAAAVQAARHSSDLLAA